MPNDQLQWLKINDFSPGIMQKLNHLSGDTAAYPPGAADATNTFRCIALPGGGLAPLPKNTGNLTRTGGNPTAAVTIGAVQGQIFTISGAHMAGPVFAAGGSGISKQELHIAYEYGTLTSGGNFNRRYQWERWRLWESTPTVDSLVGYTTDDNGPYAGIQTRPTYFHTYRAGTSQTTIGAPVVVAGWYAGGGGQTQRFWDTFPSVSALGTTGVGSISSAKNPEGIFGHQGRSVELDQEAWTHGAVGTWSSNEQVYYTDVNVATGAGVSSAAVWGQEDMEGFGAFASMNASEMMVVRVGYGGYIVRGDLDNPTVLYVPGIPGTGNTRHNAAITPVGLVYGSRNGGVWAWAGGDTADLLSPNLENDFWLPGGTTGLFVDYAGKFAFWKEWILTPNNWLYDWRNKSWWRLEDPSVISIYHWLQNTDSHIMYGCPREIGDASGSNAASLYYWNASQAATSFSWESQVLPLGDYKTAQPREFLLKAQGVGTVVFTVSGFDAQGNLQTESHTFTFASTARPEYQRCTIGSFHALTDCRIKLVSTATSLQTPIIYEVSLGYNSDPHLKTI